jgi:hypothetical protein
MLSVSDRSWFISGSSRALAALEQASAAALLLPAWPQPRPPQELLSAVVCNAASATCDRVCIAESSNLRRSAGFIASTIMRFRDSSAKLSVACIAASAAAAAAAETPGRLATMPP